MYCIACGTEIPNEANYCSHCGKAQKDNLSSKSEEATTWETCEIVWDTKKLKKGFLQSQHYDTFFWAKAVGPNGIYDAGKSGVFDQYRPPVDNFADEKDWKIAKAEVDTLVDLLAKDGWEFVGTQQLWYQKRFRRKVSNPK